MDRRRRFFRDRFGLYYRRMRFARTIIVAALLTAADITVSSLLATEIPPEQRRSGYSFMGPDTKAMQDDDTTNPGMLWVLDGEVLWKSKAGAAGKNCAHRPYDPPPPHKGGAAPPPRCRNDRRPPPHPGRPTHPPPPRPHTTAPV